MRSVVIVDTSVFCNVLNIPQMNQSRKSVIAQFEVFIKDGASLLLPMAAVYETGNHIAQLKQGNGNIRRQVGEIFVAQVRAAIAGEAPWQVMQLPSTEDIREWLVDFPDSAMRGESMGDLSIIKEWESVKIKTPNYRVLIWSLDGDLQGYDYQP